MMDYCNLHRKQSCLHSDKRAWFNEKRANFFWWSCFLKFYSTSKAWTLWPTCKKKEDL